MEPLVVVGAVAVGLCGYRTAVEFIEDVKSDGTGEAISELLKRCRAALAQVGHRLPKGRSRSAMYYRWTKRAATS